MKHFKQILQIIETYNPDYDDMGSSRMQYNKSGRSGEEQNIDDKISRLTDLDEKIRSDRTATIPNREPLLYNMTALLALKGYYFGKLHGEKYPHHANRLPKYMKVLSKEIPHLLPHLDE